MAEAQAYDMTERQARAGRLRDFLHDCAASSAAGEADCIREAGLLLPIYAGAPVADNDAIERLLESGGALCAVIAILGPDLRFMLSQGEDGNCLATVLGVCGDEGMTAQGETLGLALLIAYLSTCVEGLERDVRTEAWGAPVSVRLH